MLQMAYCFTGIMYNVGSLLAQRSGLPAWASTDAVMGIVGVALYGLFLSAGLMKNLTLYRVLMGVCVALMGYGGVVVHLLNIGHLDLYQSVFTWAGAIGINGCGLLLNLAAALGWFAPIVNDGKIYKNTVK
ncbi:MAG TPA: hypothetical protein VNI35_03995 [Nitrospira sp.]|nr:hypothetical protein [Nitrospira sp.]